METTPENTPEVTPAKKLTKEERSKIAKDAAERRWARIRRAAAKPAKASAKPARSKKKPAGPREFTSALKTAEKRLGKAIQERAEAAAKYAVLTAEIPSLGRLISALKNPFGAAPGFAMEPAVSLEQIVGDQPLTYQNPPRSISPVPPLQHPVTTQGRAMGGAIGVELAETEDEDRFLKESGVAGGEWHSG